MRLIGDVGAWANRGRHDPVPPDDIPDRCDDFRKRYRLGDEAMHAGADREQYFIAGTGPADRGKEHAGISDPDDTEIVRSGRAAKRGVDADEGYSAALRQMC